MTCPIERDPRSDRSAWTRRGAVVAFNLRNRSFLKEIDFEPRELQLPAASCRRRSRCAKYAGTEEQAPRGQGDRADLREDVHPDPVGVRGRRLRPGRACHLPGPVGLAAGPQGVDRGHRRGARPHVRRDRVPRQQAGRRRGTGRPCRRAGLQRPDRRVAPHPDAGRLPHHARGEPQALRRDRPTRSWATAGSTWAVPCWSWAR